MNIKSSTRLRDLGRNFCAPQLFTMTAAVLSCAAGMRQIRVAHLERYSHALVGSVTAVCGFAMLVLHI